MSKRHLLFLLSGLLLMAGGLVWTAIPQADEPLEPGVTMTRTPILTDFGYLPITVGDKVGPTVTATTPPPTMTPFMNPTGTPGPGTPTATATAPATATATSTATLIAATPSVTPTATATVPPTNPTPAPRDVFVTDNYTVRESGGRLQVVGEIFNNSKLMIRSVSIVGALYDGAGQLVETSYTPVQLDQLPRGDRTCFVLSFENSAGWQRIEFGAPSFKTDVDSEPNLRVRKVETEYDPVMGWFTIRGQVRNKQDEPAELVQLVGSVYDSSGKITGCGFAFVGTTDLEGQQKGQFEMVITGHDFQDAGDYKIQVEGRGN